MSWKKIANVNALNICLSFKSYSWQHDLSANSIYCNIAMSFQMESQLLQSPKRGKWLHDQ